MTKIELNDRAKKFENFRKSMIYSNIDENALDKALVNKTAQIYDANIRIDGDLKNAFKVINEAAETGNIDAMNYIAQMYFSGCGVEKDDVKSFEWSMKAAQLNDVYAIDRVGHMYYHGYGVEKNRNKSVEWHRKAAELGYTRAMRYTALRCGDAVESAKWCIEAVTLKQ